MKRIKILIFAVFFLTTTFAFARSTSQCKGQSRSSCDSGCTWVKSHTRKYKRKTVSVKGYCRKASRVSKKGRRTSNIKERKKRTTSKNKKRVIRSTRKNQSCRSLKRKDCITASNCGWKAGNRKLKTKGKCFIKKKQSKRRRVKSTKKSSRKVRNVCSSKRRKACMTARNCNWKKGNRKRKVRGKCLAK